MTGSQSLLRCHTMELLVVYQQNPTIALRNQLVRLNAGLVRKIAHRLSHQCVEPYDDLEQIGYLGLIRAIERFNPSQGYAFSSFAVPYIRGEMLHFLRDRSTTVKIPRRWKELQREGQRARLELSKTLGRQPSDQEIAEKLHVSTTEWQQIRLSVKNRSPLSLDATISHQIDVPLTLGETLPDTSSQLLESQTEERQQLLQALAQLEDQTRLAIEGVFFQNLSRKEVAQRIGVSPMTVSRRIQRGLEQMTGLLQSQTLIAK